MKFGAHSYVPHRMNYNNETEIVNMVKIIPAKYQPHRAASMAVGP